MEKRRARLVALMIAFCAATAVPCSWDDTPAFAFSVRPDDPIDLYVDGRIGIIQPTFARSHLVVAYRYLSGNPPRDEERAGMLALIAHRLKEDPAVDGAAAWESARAEFRGVKPGRSQEDERNHTKYAWFMNCPASAFLTAVNTLRDRSAKLGAKHPAVTSWLDAQEIVFSNCGEGENIPAPADASLPAIIKADRAYQIAAANFYAMRYDDAHGQFLKIASDVQSPWRQTARVVAARALLRKSTLTAEESDGEYPYEEETMRQAEAELRAILADASMKPVHEAARQLLAFAVFRLNPQQRLDETAKILAGSDLSADSVRTALADYTLLLDRDLKTAGDLTDWIRTFQSGPLTHALEQWRATKKPHWLVAAMAHATPKEANELREASAKIGPDSAAYPTIVFHRARLSMGDVRAELDRALALDDDRLGAGSRNLLLAQRRATARSVAEFIRDAQLIPIGLAAEQTVDTYDQPVIPEDAAALMTHSMPLRMLAEAATMKDPPAKFRNPILVAAWTRAILLDREDVASQLFPTVLALRPGIDPRFTVWKNASGDERRFAAADLVVHYGGLTPNVPAFGGRIAYDNDIESVNHNGGNWWCTRVPEERANVPPFLAAATDVAEEQLALTEESTATTWMLRTFIERASTHPKDPRVPEALALAIQGTRWTCGDSETDKLAERAFGVLHKKYATTQWAKDTPYWYRSGW